MHAYALYPQSSKLPTWAVITLVSIGVSILGALVAICVVVLRSDGVAAPGVPVAVAALPTPAPDVTPLPPGPVHAAAASVTPMSAAPELAVADAPPVSHPRARVVGKRHAKTAKTPRTTLARSKSRTTTVAAAHPGRKHKKDDLDRLLGL